MKKSKYLLLTISVILILACGAYSLSVLTSEHSIPVIGTEEASAESGSVSPSDNAASEEALLPLLPSEDEEATASSAEPDLSDASEASREPDPPAESAFEEYDLTLMALGDNLLHMGIVNTGKQTDGTYDFSFLFDGVADFLAESDIKVINQETILGGNELGFSGYPLFNSPTEVGDAIAEAGFNVVLHSSNHTGDKGASGLISCAKFWEAYPDVLVGGIRADKEARQIPLLTVGDITFAVLNYSYSANTANLNPNLWGLMDMLCYYDTTTGQLDFTRLHSQVTKDIAAAKELADIVIVFPHWGNEYTTTPSRYQQLFAQQMTEAGADLIIGTHPHVIQPVEWITADNGNRALCFYSLGNYVSTQKNPLCMLEAMAWVTFHVTEEDIYIDESNTGAIPLVCHYTDNPVRFESVYLLEDYTAEQAAAHGILGYGGVALELPYLQTQSSEVLGEWVITGTEALFGRAVTRETGSSSAPVSGTASGSRITP